ncbi:MAG: yhjG2 [Labilithrix sp.]|nr:yhjG2 [Labilithrix sp.]
MFTLLHEIAPLLLDLVEPALAPAAVLIRPDGHVAWVAEGTDDGLREALTTWCGPR